MGIGELGDDAGRVIRPIWLPPYSVNQRLPSGPAVIPSGSLLAVGTGELGDDAGRVIRPILLPSDSVNQRLPSGPAVMPSGLAAGRGDRRTR